MATQLCVQSRQAIGVLGGVVKAGENNMGLQLRANSPFVPAPGIFPAARTVRADIPWRSLFEGSREENALAVAPLLFPLSGTPNRSPPHLMRWIEEHGSYTSSIVLMASPLSLDKLLRRLAARLDRRRGRRRRMTSLNDFFELKRL